MDYYLNQFENCLQWAKPFCTVACPFHMDVLDFQEKMARGSINAAFKTFRNAVGFPAVVATLCPEYCTGVCPRAEIDQSVQLHLLEKTCEAKATKKDPVDYNVPKKNRKIGIVGAGASGLACALRLASKKYDVTVYERSGRLGGQLWDLLPSELFLSDINRQFQFETYTLHFNTEIQECEDLASQHFEAVYIATGKNGADFGLLSEENGFCRAVGETAFFAGGSLTGKDPVRAIADGLAMAWAIEIWLKTAKLEYPTDQTDSKAVANPDKLLLTEAVIPTAAGLFTEEEAIAEASRCIRCQCDACRTQCDLCAFYKKWPLKLRDEIMATISPSDSMIHGTPAIRLINTCTQCKLCEEYCPAGIELGEMIREARHRLHKLGKMPGAYHQFWLADMEFANGEFASIRKLPSGKPSKAYAFFPGCQLGASDPRYVLFSYRSLLEVKPDTGLLLRCCGIPAEWAGNEERHTAEISALRNDWETLGRPVFITACPSCQKHLGEFLPEIETVSLYEIFEQWAVAFQNSTETETYTVFDPCAARHASSMQNAVRHLAIRSGLLLEELPKGDRHVCCGYGGHGSVANPAFADYIAKKRAAESSHPYLAYCVNCRDIFLDEGKPSRHILDILYGLNKESNPLPSLAQRRQNRTLLKEQLLNEFFGEPMKSKPAPLKYKLLISPEIHRKMNELQLLEEDLCKVLDVGEEAGQKTFDLTKNTFSCFRELGYVTCWVEYRKAGGTFEIVNVYTHRIRIEMEMIWNGRKTDPALR